MKVLFILPNLPEKINNYLKLPSLEMAAMSYVLKKQEIQCEMIDMLINNMSLEEFEKELQRKRDVGLICIESTASNHCIATKIIKICKRIFINTPVALSGELASFLPKEMLERNFCLDYCLRFDSEKTILNLIKEIKNGKKEFFSINNLAYREKEKIIVTSITPKEELQVIEGYDRELYDLEKYLLRDSETIVRSSRGCPGNCHFCVKTKMAKFRIFPISQFCDEIQFLLNKGFRSFFFADDTFAFSDQRLDEFYEEVKKRDMHFSWTSNIRIVDINEEKIRKMKEIGAYRVFVGIETINAKSSKIINKNINEEEIMKKIDILKKYNLEFHASFIVGSPGDTEEDLMETEKFLEKLNPTLVTFNQLKLFPGTDIYINPEKYNIICEDMFWFEKDDWAYFPVVGTKELPPDKIYTWSNRLLRKFISL